MFIALCLIWQNKVKWWTENGGPIRMQVVASVVFDSLCYILLTTNLIIPYNLMIFYELLFISIQLEHYLNIYFGLLMLR